MGGAKTQVEDEEKEEDKDKEGDKDAATADLASACAQHNRVTPPPTNKRRYRTPSMR